LSPKSEVCRDLDFGEKSVNTKREKPVNTKNKRCHRISFSSTTLAQHLVFTHCNI
jgi:hypothetical protein